MKNKAVFVLVVIFLALIPFINTKIKTGTFLPGIIPSYTDDDVYYYARMMNVFNGYPLIGNPYYFEHRNEISPAFIVPDWISAAPLFLGIDLGKTVIFNFIFWSIIFCCLGYITFRKFYLPEIYSMVFSVGVYISSYILIFRPVSIQIIAPVYLLFNLALYNWLNKDKHSFKDNLFLVLSIVFSFYIYTYLLQIVVITLVLVFLYFVLRKNWQGLKEFVVLGIISGTLITPFIYITFKQVTTINYWDTMYRVGLVASHLPTSLSILDTLRILAILGGFYLIGYLIQAVKNDKTYDSIILFMSLTGLGLILSLYTNVITGKEFEIANHIERFIIIWLSISFFVSLYYLSKNFLELKRLSLIKKGLIFGLFVINFLSYVHYVSQEFTVRLILDAEVVSIQKYKEPLNWLNQNTKSESVIWSDWQFGTYIPIKTRNFQLFHPNGGLHFMTLKEQEERYLVSRYFDNITTNDLKKNFRIYAGVGNSVHQYMVHNRKVKICQLIRLKYFGYDCGGMVDAASFKGEDYFNNLLSQYKNIQKNIVTELKKFNVEYIVKNKNLNNGFNPKQIPGTKLLWSDGNFEIYSFE